jgi:hypothetical protein
VDIALRLGFIDSNLFAIFIILAVVSAVLAPSLGKHILTMKKTA